MSLIGAAPLVTERHGELEGPDVIPSSALAAWASKFPCSHVRVVVRYVSEAECLDCGARVRRNQ